MYPSVWCDSDSFFLNLSKQNSPIFTHMELIIDFSFQNWTQEGTVRVFPLGEGSVCVFHIHHLFILVAEVVVRRCRQISGLELADEAKKDKQ